MNVNYPCIIKLKLILFQFIRSISIYIYGVIEKVLNSVFET